MRKTTDPVEHGKWLEALNQSNAAQFAAASVGGAGNYFRTGEFNAASHAVDAMAAMSGRGPGAASQVKGTMEGSASRGKMNAAIRHPGGLPAAASVQEARSAYDQAKELGKGEALQSIGNGVPQVGEAIGRSVGKANLLREKAQMDVLSALSQVTGMSMGDAAQALEGAGKTLSLTPEKMSNFLDRSGLGGKLSSSVSSALREQGGTVTLGMAPDGQQGLSLVMTSARTGDSGMVDYSSTYNARQTDDRSINVDSSINSKAGINAPTPLAARQVQVEALRSLRNSLQSALESGDLGQVMAVGLEAAKYTGSLLGADSKASAQETGVDGKGSSVSVWGGAQKSFGVDDEGGKRGKRKGGKAGKDSDGASDSLGGTITEGVKDLVGEGLAGMVADVMGVKGQIGGRIEGKGESTDRRTDSHQVSVAGYYGEMQAWARQAMADYQQAMANPNVNESAVVNGEFRDMMDAAQAYWGPKVEQAIAAADEQGEQLDHGSGMGDRLQSLVDDALKKYW